MSDFGGVGGSFKDHTCPMVVEQYSGYPPSQTGSETIGGRVLTISDRFICMNRPFSNLLLSVGSIKEL